MTEKFDFKFQNISADGVEKTSRSCNLRPLNLQKLFKWIDSQPIDENLKVELKLSASKYPHQALDKWQKNYARHVAIAQKKLKSKTESSKNEKTSKKTNGIDHFDDEN